MQNLNFQVNYLKEKIDKLIKINMSLLNKSKIFY